MANTGPHHHGPANAAIAKGTSAAEFKGWVLENKIRGEEKPILPPATAIGLSGKEAHDFSFRKQAFPGADITYPYEVAFQPAVVMADVQLVHATRASLPSPRFPGEQGWYFNQGESTGVTPEWFTAAAMIAAGR